MDGPTNRQESRMKLFDTDSLGNPKCSHCYRVVKHEMAEECGVFVRSRATDILAIGWATYVCNNCLPKIEDYIFYDDNILRFIFAGV